MAFFIFRDMDKKYILSFDQGTSSSRVVLFDRYQQQLGMEQLEFSQYYPMDGWVEHNAEEIWTSQIKVAKQLIGKLDINPLSIAAIGIANQRETTVVWDRETGRPIHNAIVWQDRRTAPLCDSIRNNPIASHIKKVTGLVIDSYFSATKLNWILKNIPGARQMADNGRLAFGTIDTWLLWKLTGGKVHATDVSNASRTMLFNLYSMDWDRDILNYFNIPESILPQVKPSNSYFGETLPSLFNGYSIPITGMLGDQQAALFGQRCLEPGELKNTYGTGCFMLMNIGENITHSNDGLLTTVAWQIDDKPVYALEGSVFIAGASVKWLRDGLGLIKTAEETEKLARSVEDSMGLYLVPAFSGLGAPYWDMYARGVLIGITQATTAAHITRATLESIAYQTRDIVELMSNASGIVIKKIKADGGASANEFLMQFQSDILDIPVYRPAITEATALGAAMMAGLGVGFYDKTDLKSDLPGRKVFMPKMQDDLRSKLYGNWKKAVQKSLGWAREN